LYIAFIKRKIYIPIVRNLLPYREKSIALSVRNLLPYREKSIALYTLPSSTPSALANT